MADTKLLPCPFCGGEAITHGSGRRWLAYCSEPLCVVSPDTAAYSKRAAAVAAWNTRTPDPRLAAAQGLADALTAVKQEWPHKEPDDCYSTGPLTGDVFADHVLCPGCAVQSKIYSALTAWEKAVR